MARLVGGVFIRLVPQRPSGTRQCYESDFASAILLRAKRGLTSSGIRYEFFRPANQNTREAKDKWKTGIESLRKTGAAYGEALANGPAEVVVTLLADGFPEKLNEELMKRSPGERQETAEKFFADQVRSKQLSISQEKWTAFQTARNAHLKQQVAFYKDTLDRRLFTLEFTYQRPKDEPEYGSLTFVWGRTVGTHEEVVSLNGLNDKVAVPNWSLTFNTGVNYFWDKDQVQKDRWLRDFQVAFQADRKLWKWKFLNQPTLTLAGYYQRLTDDAVISFNSDAIVPNTGIVLPKPANVILKNTKGDVGIAQVKRLFR